MDAISEGWQYGRAIPSVQLHRWEDHLDEPLCDLRRAHGINPLGRGPLLAEPASAVAAIP